MFNLLLVVHPFDEQIRKLAIKFQPMINSKLGKLTDISKVYHLFLKLQQNKTKKKHILKSINLCNSISK